MLRLATLLFFTVLTGLGANAAPAQTPASASTSGTLVIVPAFGEVTQANDEAHAVFMIEEQHKDKATAASLVNTKMKRGTEIIRQADSKATLKTRGYYTYPVYADEQARVPNGKARPLIGWRVGQYLDVTTIDLDGLPKTVAAAQSVLALNGLQFGLAEATRKKLDQQRIDATYQNMMERIRTIAAAMGRNMADAVIDTVDFEGSGAYAPSAPAPKMMRAAAAMDAAPVEEPSFEPGETTLSMRLVGKFKFK
jgi:uncharacterized protein YggE